MKYIDISPEEIYELTNKGTILLVDDLNLLNTIYEELPFFCNFILI